MNVDINGLVGEMLASNAEEFLDAIEPRRSEFLKSVTRGSSDWIFRGHGDATWALQPSSLRDGTKFWLHGSWGSVSWSETHTNRAQAFFEAVGVYHFFNRADREGLVLPEDSQRLRRQLARIAASQRAGALDEMTEDWPADEALSVLALAQHHGLPTRLLDWTFNPFTAAYFAAMGAIERERRELGNAYLRAGGAPGWSTQRRRDLGEMCVWILRADSVKANTDLHDSTRASLVLVTAPTASNPNLRAQEGIFTMTRRRLEPNAPVDRRPLTETPELIHPQLVERFRAGSQKAGFGDSFPLLLKVKVAASEAPNVLRHLALHGTSAASLYPGYEGVVRAMRDEEIWEHLND